MWKVLKLVKPLFGNISDFCKNSCTTLLVLCLFLWMHNLQLCMEQGAVNEEVKDWALWCPPFVMLDICNKLFCCNYCISTLFPFPVEYIDYIWICLCHLLAHFLLIGYLKLPNHRKLYPACGRFLSSLLIQFQLKKMMVWTHQHG